MPSYAGIGSRRTPAPILVMMRTAACELANRGWTLRTGGAEGADQAFLEGADGIGGRVDLFLPWPNFMADEVRRRLWPNVMIVDRPAHEAYEIARKYHPNWKNLRHSVQSLHARNAHQVLGANLDDPVRFILCWTPNGGGTGGTGQAIRMAADYRIPVFDLGRVEARARLQHFLASARSGVSA